MEENQLCDHGSGHTDPAIQPCSHDPGDPSKEADKEIEPGGLSNPVAHGIGKPSEDGCEEKGGEDDKRRVDEWMHGIMMVRMADQSNENRRRQKNSPLRGFLSCAYGGDRCSLHSFS